jgi:hypothetical protein
VKIGRSFVRAAVAGGVVLAVGLASTSTGAVAQTVGEPQRQNVAGLSIRELTVGQRPASFVNQSFRVVCQRADGVFVSFSRSAIGGNPMQNDGTVNLGSAELPGVATSDFCRVGFVTDNRADRLAFTVGSGSSNSTIPFGPDDWFRAAGFNDVIRSSASVPAVGQVNLLTVYENDLTVVMAGPGAHEVTVNCNSGGPRVVFGLAEGGMQIVNGIPAGGLCVVQVLNPAVRARIQETNETPNDGLLRFRSRRSCQETPVPECVFTATVIIESQTPTSAVLLPTVPVVPDPAATTTVPTTQPGIPTTAIPSTVPGQQPATTRRPTTTRRTTVPPKPATTKPSRPVATVCKTVGGRKYCGPLSSALKPGQAKPKSVPPTTKKKKR